MMTTLNTELTMLAYAAILCVAQAFPYTLALIAKVGPFRAMSYPQLGEDVLPDWAKRAKRSHLNFVENLAPFAIAVLTAHALGVSNETTAMGAMLFVGARVVMFFGHTLALPGVRTVAWFASLAGIGMILSQVL